MTHPASRPAAPAPAAGAPAGQVSITIRDGGSPYALISTDAREIWRELRGQ